MSTLINMNAFSDAFLPKYVSLQIYPGYSQNFSFPKSTMIIFNRWNNANISVYGKKLREDSERREMLGPYWATSSVAGFYYPDYEFSLLVNSTSDNDDQLVWSEFIIDTNACEKVYVTTNPNNVNLKINHKTCFVDAFAGNKVFNFHDYDEESKDILLFNRLSKIYPHSNMSFQYRQPIEIILENSHKPLVIDKEGTPEDGVNNNQYEIDRIISFATLHVISTNVHLIERNAMLGLTIAWTVFILLISAITFIILLKVKGHLRNNHKNDDTSTKLEQMGDEKSTLFAPLQF